MTPAAIFELYRGRSRRPIVRIVPDGRLFRVVWPDVGRSDLANLTRCKDAALTWAQRRVLTENRNLSVAQRLKSLHNFRWVSSPVASAADFELAARDAA
jgi:hypothetical protein